MESCMVDKIFKKAQELISVIDCEKSRLEELELNLKSTYKMPELSIENASQMIDHTLLAFNATEKDIEKLCEDAYKFNFAAVCVNPVWVKYADEVRKDFYANFKIASVIDFPLGAGTLDSRIKETETALKNGADEIDIVISLGLLKSKKVKETYTLLKEVIEIGGFHKVILEMSELDAEEKIIAPLIAFFAGANMLKTSTGINGKATEPDVRLLRMIAGNSLGVKAAGGIRDKATFYSMVKSGADRIGSSSSLKIIENWDN